MAKSSSHSFLISATQCAIALLLLEGCAFEQALRSQDDPAGQGRPGASPAKEQVRTGLAEIVMTDRRWQSFDEAREHRVSAVADGSPLYLNIRTPRPLGELALPAEAQGRYTFSPYPHLYLHVGDDTSLRSLNTCYLTLSPQEMAARDLVVPLAPPDLRPGGNLADCWLAAANSSSRGPRNYELRLAGLASRLQNWLPVADLLAVEVISADYSGGTPRYAAMLAAPQQSAVTPAAVSQPAATLEPVSPPNASPQASPPPSAPPLPEPTASQGSTPQIAPAEATARAAVPPAVAAATPLPEPPSAEPRRVPGSMLVQPAPDVRTVPAPAATVTAIPAANVEALPAAPSEDLVVRSMAAAEAPAAGRERQVIASQAPGRIVIYSPAGDAAADARARVLRERLAAGGEFYIDLRYVTTFDAADNIRIFFEADRDRAVVARDRVADEGTLPIRDFSGQRPLPSPGTIELWLASTRADGGGGIRRSAGPPP